MNEKADTAGVASTAEPAITVVRGFNEALARGDMAGMLDFLDPMVEWRAPESVPWGGTFHGHEGFREFIGRILEQPAEFRREILEYLDAGERIVVLLRQMGRRKGGDIEYDVPEVHIWTVRDGKIGDFEGSFDTATVLRTLQLEPRVSQSSPQHEGSEGL